MVSTSSEVRSVLVVDDSALIRRVVCDVIASSGDFRVAGEASNGSDALAAVHDLDPDIVTLDIAMPGLSGLETLGCLMSEFPRPVVMLSGQESSDGVELTVRALELGAVDFVRKPSSASALDEFTLRHRLLQALRSASGVHVEPPVSDAQPKRSWRAANSHSARRLEPHSNEAVPATHLVVIASSTGGPRALAELIPRLELGAGVAVVIVQHMPESFTASLARRLQELGPRPVYETTGDALLASGFVYVARGGSHTKILRDREGVPRFALEDSAPVHSVRPAADPLFESAVREFGAEVTAVVLTGMGRDGATGCRTVRRAGGRVVVQEPSSCVVAGMGQSVLAVAGADAVVTLADMPRVLHRLSGSQSL